MSNGYNPVTWDCSLKGCFNQKRRPKIEHFSECFPRNIGMGDVDGLVELSGNFLMLEWKSGQTAEPGRRPSDREVKRGQQMTYQAVTKMCPFCVFIVEGSAETMEVRFISIVWNGEISAWRPCSLDDLKARMARWAEYAQQNRRAA